MVAISPQFAYGELPVLQRPTGLLVTLAMLAGAVYLAAIWMLKLPLPGPRARATADAARPGRGWWLWVLGVGLGMRALMIPSTPMLETDYFRYLWDGAVVAHGHNPYAHAPEAVLNGEAPVELVELGEASGLVLERVNHPWLTTIYPPTAQAGFALAHTASPWRIEGLRLVWFLFDLVTLGLLIGLLRQLALPLSALLIYWWNPLLIREGYNTAHMEMTLLPFVVAALWLAVRHRLLASGIALAMAVGAKLWPVLLLPTLLRQCGGRWNRIGTAAGVFALLGALIVSPMLLTHFGETAGLRAYAGTWQINDTLYQGFYLLGRWIAPEDAHRAARLMVAFVLLGWIAWLCRRPAHNGRAVCERALWIVACLFLLSPTQLPWYWLWLLPMLVVRPSPGLLVLTATLPLYYLRFPMRELGYSAWFNHGVVWLQFAPAFLLLAWEAWRRTSRLEQTLAADPRHMHGKQAGVRS
ncbi:MAG: glycosyltransferase family 87 protein [Phycisphaeraceae bacterium]